MMRAVRVLGACGIISAACSACGGFAEQPVYIGLAGLVMLFGNIFALLDNGKAAQNV